MEHPSRHSAAVAAPSCTDIDRKRLATLQACTALWGGSLTATESDNGHPMFIVTRWALTRAFDSMADVEDWLQRVGARGG